MTLTITWTGELDELPKLREALDGVMRSLKRREKQSKVDKQPKATSGIYREDFKKEAVEPWQKVEILKLYNDGKPINEIAQTLGFKDGRNIQWVIRKADLRKASEQEKPVEEQPEKVILEMPPQESPKEPESNPAPKKLKESEPEPEPESEPDPYPNEKPAPKAINRIELDLKMWDMHKAGLTPDEISDKLHEEGYYYGSGAVRTRLKAQGAQI